MTVSLGEVRVSRFMAVLRLLTDFAGNNRDFFRDLEEWKHTQEMSPSILAFIEGFKLFTTEERGRFVEFLKVVSRMLEESEDTSLFIEP